MAADRAWGSEHFAAVHRHCAAYAELQPFFSNRGAQILDVESLHHGFHDPVHVGKLFQVIVEVSAGDQ